MAKNSVVFRGNKPIHECVLRNGKHVAMPAPTEVSREWKEFPSISQAKHFCLEQMRAGHQIRKGRD